MTEQGERLKFSQSLRLVYVIPWIGFQMLFKTPQIFKQGKILKRLRGLFKESGMSNHWAGCCIPIHSIVSQGFDSPRFVELAPDFQDYIKEFDCTVVYRQVKHFLTSDTVLPEFRKWLLRLDEEDFFENQALGSLNLQLGYCRQREELSYFVQDLESLVNSLQVRKSYSEGEA